MRSGCGRMTGKVASVKQVLQPPASAGVPPSVGAEGMLGGSSSTGLSAGAAAFLKKPTCWTSAGAVGGTMMDEAAGDCTSTGIDGALARGNAAGGAGGGGGVVLLAS